MDMEEKKALVLRMLASQQLVVILEGSENKTGEIEINKVTLNVEQVKERTGWGEEEILEVFNELDKEKFIEKEGEKITMKID